MCAYDTLFSSIDCFIIKLFWVFYYYKLFITVLLPINPWALLLPFTYNEFLEIILLGQGIYILRLYAHIANIFSGYLYQIYAPIDIIKQCLVSCMLINIRYYIWKIKKKHDREHCTYIIVLIFIFGLLIRKGNCFKSLFLHI